MSKALGVVFLIVGAVLIYFGWHAHELTTLPSASVVDGDEGSRSIWQLMIGAVAAVWGLAVLLRRRT